MTKKPGILIGVLALLCLAVPLSVFVDVPTISGLWFSVSYHNLQENKVMLSHNITNNNSDMGAKVYCNDLTPFSFLKKGSWEAVEQGAYRTNKFVNWLFGHGYRSL